ncbi:DUF2269 family protein [Rubellimicrobium arenae]|uniref:DUF2269 family protein n=1 Tax=Rubellimicrobium arenae TaxID=2817372 RepID=UPI001B308A24|nr:DUF2269 family protein [Rubellimicrobium arenae]
MDPYLLLKFAHVMAAIFWVGGASILTLLVLILDRRGDDAATMTGVSYVALLGNRVFAPLGLFTIVTGLAAAWLGSWGFAAWTILAAMIVACTFVLGALFLGPTCERAVKSHQESGDAAASMVHGRRVLRLVKLDLAGQFAIISLMVLKPSWTDLHLLVPAALLLLGGLAVLRAPGRPVAAQPA